MALFAGAPLRTIECVMVTTGARVPAARGGVGAWWVPSRGPGVGHDGGWGEGNWEPVLVCWWRDPSFPTG